MKKYGSVLLSLLLISVVASAQSQPENPGFEEWEDIAVGEGDTIREPVDWSSLKTSDDPALSTLSPVVIIRSADAHSGEYSIKLTNVQSFIVVNGVVTNGRLHPNFEPTLAYIFTDTVDNQWNTPLTARPDSIAGWLKYTPQGDDSVQVKAILHRGFGKQPDEEFTENWIGVAEYISPLDTGDEWVRFSAPFSYFTADDPQYILIVLNSGSGYTPVAGSIALFDDLELIYNTPQSFRADPGSPDGLIYVIGHRTLVLKGVDPSGFHTVRIHDVTGKLAWSGRITSDRIDLSATNLRNGIYMVTLIGKSNLLSQKIMLH